MKKMYLDQAKTLPLDPARVVAWGARRAHCVAVVEITDPSLEGFDSNHRLVAQLTDGGEWVRVWRGRGKDVGTEQVEGEEMSRATRYRRAKAAQKAPRVPNRSASTSAQS